MKNKFTLLGGLLFSLLFSPKIAHTQWLENISPNTSSNLRDIEVFDSVYYFIGTGDFFAKCSGDCNQIELLTAPAPVGFFNRNLTVLDTNCFFVMSTQNASDMQVNKSIDGGYTWTTVFDTTNYAGTELLAFDTLNLIVTKTFYEAVKTTDGGLTWQAEYQPLIISSSSLILNDSTAIMGVNESFVITTDKGNTWLGSGFDQSNPRKFASSGNDTLVAVSEGSGFHFSYSFNRGSNWNSVYLQHIDPYGIYYEAKDEIYVLGKSFFTNNAVIMVTKNLGQSWYSFDTQISGTLNDIVFLNDSIALLSGTDGMLLKWNKNAPLTYLGTAENNLSENIQIFPNPTNTSQTITLNFIQNSNVKINLHDIAGNLIRNVYDGEIETGQTQLNVSLVELPKGMYVYHFLINDKSYHSKMIKQ